MEEFNYICRLNIKQPIIDGFKNPEPITKNAQHWNLDAGYLGALKEFLERDLNELIIMPKKKYTFKDLLTYANK